MASQRGAPSSSLQRRLLLRSSFGAVRVSQRFLAAPNLRGRRTSRAFSYVSACSRLIHRRWPAPYFGGATGAMRTLLAAIFPVRSIPNS